MKAPYLTDRAPANTPLRLDGVDYPKGLWVPADTALTYTIGGDFREFKAVVGILDQVGRRGDRRSGDDQRPTFFAGFLFGGRRSSGRTSRRT